MIIEICANGFESAQVAHDAGADHIELCTELSVGGLTPSRELIQKVISQLSIPTHVLIRPRPGDFCYSQVEFDHMLADIAFCKEEGCAGVVSGVLQSHTGIDIERTRQLIDASEGMEFTFHRAFDYCNRPLEALESLKQLGVTRILSSGQAGSAEKGLSLLKQMQVASEGTVQIMPGGGITSENALLFKSAGFEMIHFSATKKEAEDLQGSDLLNKKVTGYSDPGEIKKILKLLA